MTILSAELAATPASGIRALANAAWAVPDAIHLELGEPDLPTPAHVVAAADAAARAGRTGYGPSVGLPELRGAAVAKLARDNGLTDATVDQVVVTAGGVGALFAAYRTLLSAGDEVLVPDPGWANFVGLATVLGATARGYRLDPDANFDPDYDHLDALRGPRTRAIVVNSPSNPVGFQWTAAQLARLGEWAARHGIVVISDECYDQLWLDTPAVSFAAAAPDVPSVTVFSLSKSYAMTGWRVGYAVAAPDLAAGLARFQETTASCVNTVAQHAAIAALTGDQGCVAAMRDRYRSRRDAALPRLDRLGLTSVRPAGAFYLWLRVTDGGVDTGPLALDLLRATGTALAPGTAFGSRGADHLRLSLAAPDADVVRGLENLAAFLADPGRREPPSQPRPRITPHP
ncbi:pyridoxal phosphate-dependent aminotransferase [Micromonospora sp. 067-2]|uniref:pyridoxal phosphate-dependent aminotransferase n=1 Tax=Micromonospora sp. 067-2 TaxID=2789270 RepID=UPI00397B3DEA